MKARTKSYSCVSSIPQKCLAHIVDSQINVLNIWQNVHRYNSWSIEFLNMYGVIGKRRKGKFSSYWRMIFRKVIITIMNILHSRVSCFKSENDFYLCILRTLKVPGIWLSLNNCLFINFRYIEMWLEFNDFLYLTLVHTLCSVNIYLYHLSNLLLRAIKHIISSTSSSGNNTASMLQPFP